MTTISLKLPDALLEASGKNAERLNVSRLTDSPRGRVIKLVPKK